MAVGSGSSTNILRFSYDASGNAVAVDYSTDNVQHLLLPSQCTE